MVSFEFCLRQFLVAWKYELHCEQSGGSPSRITRNSCDPSVVRRVGGMVTPGFGLNEAKRTPVQINAPEGSCLRPCRMLPTTVPYCESTHAIFESAIQIGTSWMCNWSSRLTPKLCFGKMWLSPTRNPRFWM